MRLLSLFISPHRQSSMLNITYDTVCICTIYQHDFTTQLKIEMIVQIGGGLSNVSVVPSPHSYNLSLNFLLFTTYCMFYLYTPIGSVRRW